MKNPGTQARRMRRIEAKLEELCDRVVLFDLILRELAAESVWQRALTERERDSTYQRLKEICLRDERTRQEGGAPADDLRARLRRELDALSTELVALRRTA